MVAPRALDACGVWGRECRRRDFTAFREDLIHELVGNWRTQKARRGRKRKETPFRLENVSEHFPAKGEGSDHTCQVCREKRCRSIAVNPDVPNAELPHKLSKTTFKCEACDVYLCISRQHNCFCTRHTQVEYWRQSASLDRTSLTSSVKISSDEITT